MVTVHSKKKPNYLKHTLLYPHLHSNNSQSSDNVQFKIFPRTYSLPCGRSNPLSPNINMNLLHTVLHTFLMLSLIHI